MSLQNLLFLKCQFMAIKELKKYKSNRSVAENTIKNYIENPLPNKINQQFTIEQTKQTKIIQKSG